MAANVSSTFRIIVDEILQGGTAAANATVTNPGRTFRVVSVLVTGAATAVFVLNKNNAGATVVAQTTIAAGDLNDFPCLLPIDGPGPSDSPAALTFTSTDNLFLRESSGGAAITRVVVVCEAATPQALTVT